MTFLEEMNATFSKRMNTVVCSLQEQASFLLVRDLRSLSQATEQNALFTPSHSFHHNLLCNERLLNQPYPNLRKTQTACKSIFRDIHIDVNRASRWHELKNNFCSKLTNPPLFSQDWRHKTEAKHLKKPLDRGREQQRTSVAWSQSWLTLPHPWASCGCQIQWDSGLHDPLLNLQPWSHHIYLGNIELQIKTKTEQMSSYCLGRNLYLPQHGRQHSPGQGKKGAQIIYITQVTTTSTTTTLAPEHPGTSAWGSSSLTTGAGFWLPGGCRSSWVLVSSGQKKGKRAPQNKSIISLSEAVLLTKGQTTAY